MKTEPGSCQWCPEQEAVGTNWSTEVPSDHQAALLYSSGNKALAQAAQGHCGVFSLEISNSLLDMALGTLLWVSLMSSSWSKWTQRFLPSFDTVIENRPA